MIRTEFRIKKTRSKGWELQRWDKGIFAQRWITMEQNLDSRSTAVAHARAILDREAEEAEKMSEYEYKYISTAEIEDG